MTTSKKRLIIALAILSVLTLVVTGIPFEQFSQVAFANLYGSSSATEDGVTAVVSANADGSCNVAIAGSNITVGPGTGIGTGDGAYSVVKNVVASEDPNYRVIQINNSDNTQEFEIWLNLATPGCAVRGLPA